MTLPVSKYEELLETVRSLKRQTIRVRELASPLLDTIISANSTAAPAGASSLEDEVDVIQKDCVDWCRLVLDNKKHQQHHRHRRRHKCMTQRNVLNDYHKNRSTNPMDSLAVERQRKTSLSTQLYDDSLCSPSSTGSSSSATDFQSHISVNKKHTSGIHMSVSSEPETSTGRDVPSSMYHGTWPVERGLWNSEPPNLNHRHYVHNQTDVTSVMSFASSSGAAPLDKVLNDDDDNHTKSSQQNLEVKVDVVYSLLSMLGTQECPDMGETLLALSSSPESSLAMRHAGCLSVLVQLVYSESDKETREKASKALCNLVQVQPDDKLKKRELKILRLLDEIRIYCITVLDMKEKGTLDKNVADNHPSQVTENIIKLSFDAGYRHNICELGGIYALANLVESDHAIHGENPENDQCILLRRYAGMALTNLTFGHSQNKSLLCSFKDFMKCLVAQLSSSSDELRQVTASVLRNLSWHADNNSRTILREVGSVPALMSAAMISRKESTLKSILSALWNLSAHCSMNKADICSVDGSLGFLVEMLNYKPPSKTLTIIENAGGILRNISSHIAVREDYRSILREHNCLQVLLQQLKSPSLTIVSNACGTLWNLSAKCHEDQKALWDMGAAPMLRSLNHSKHIMIATGSRGALKNLLSSRPAHAWFNQIDQKVKELGLPVLPTLVARKQRALVKDLDQNLAETCENIEPTSPTLKDEFSASKSQTRRKFKYSSTPKKETEEEEIIESFNSLSLSNDKCGKLENNSSGSVSLPYTSTSHSNRAASSTSTYIPVGSKYSDCSFEDDNLEEPIDFAEKYSETTNYQSSPKPETASTSKCQKSNPNTYSDYAETDLDQPTDYSLRYAENDSDSEEVVEHKNTVIRPERYYFSQDTLKTYCTEGTPYETPHNFSTATSMSDLRLDSNPDEKNQSVEGEEVTKKQTDNEKVNNIEADLNESYELTPETNHVNTPEKKLKSGFSSGLLTPEKPVNYCLEGTPRSCSRGSSFSSLNLEETVETKPPKPDAENVIKNIKEQNYVEEKEESVVITSSVKNENKIDGEETTTTGKVVTFGNVVDYAEETPLMFSRCSSLGSLGSIEQHSIHDDRSSVISDFSRLTSGIISPSELPDSPTQTVPPSPRQKKAPIEFPISNSVPENKVTVVVPQTLLTSQPPPPPVQQSKSVFEDNMNKYKEVNTPVEFSVNTSLSSLTIDDEPNVTAFNLMQNTITNRQNVSETSVNTSGEVLNTSSDNKVMINNRDDDEESVGDRDEEILAACINKGMQNVRYGGQNQTQFDETIVSDCESEEQEDLLAKCINSGMQNNRYRQKQQQHKLENNNADEKSSSCSKLPSTFTAEEDEEKLLVACIKLGMHNNRYCQNDKETDIKNEVKVCKTEEENEENLLAACIRMGMEYNRYSQNKIESEENDEELLAACINKGIQNHRYRQSRQQDDNSARHQSALPKYQKKSPHRTGIPIKYDSQSTKIRLPEQESSMDRMKTFCTEDTPAVLSHIGSQSDLSTLSFSSKEKIEQQYIGAVDEMRRFAVEDSPCHFSLGSSLSDLTVDGNVISHYRSNQDREKQECSGEVKTGINENLNESVNQLDSLSSLSVESFNSADEALLEKCIKSGMPKNSSKTGLPVRRRSRNEKSEQFCLSEEAEQALLEQCILKGMPKRKSSKNVNNKHLDTNLGNDSNSSVVEPQSTSSKNVYVASVVTSTVVRMQQQGPPPPPQTTMITDVQYTDTDVPDNTDQLYEPVRIESNTMKNGFNEDDDSSPEHSDKITAAQNRMLDPDAMIESLDRFTAELVSQSSHLHQNPNLVQSGADAGDTWNDDTSPNDVSFPSISVSIPLAASFKSDTESNGNNNNKFVYDTVDGVKDSEESNQFSSFNTVLSGMSDSTIIAIEAAKIVNVVENDMIQSATSVNSLELEQVKPPSIMESLISISSSISELPVSPKCSPVPRRKRSIPAGLMVRRALSNSSQMVRSIENLAENTNSVSSSYNLDHIKPPSVMGDYLDIIDMENSITSVCSITSEIFETPNIKTDFIANGLITNVNNSVSNWMFDVKQPINYQSLTDIENINPPSLLNEVTDLCTSTADVLTENVYSETEVFEDCLTHTMEQSLKTVDDITEYSDANSVTPIQSDFGGSSAESTPKKVKNLNILTPKQKRQLAKERYKTYTVAAEMVVRENASPNSSPQQETSTKLTPKERRQLDRERFQTRVLNGTIPMELITSNPEQTESLTKLDIRKALRQKRRENMERFRTRTLSSDDIIPSSPEQSPAPDRRTLPTEDLHLMLEHEAKIVLDTLKQSHHVNGRDELLECETLSLVSNEDDSEHNSVSSVNYRTYHKSWGFSKNLPVIQSTTGTSKIITKPKIVKPDTETEDVTTNEDVDVEKEQGKGIRGRRKALYSAPNRKQIIARNIKPIKTVTSNLVRNVTSTLRTNTVKKSNVNIRPPPSIQKSIPTKTNIKKPSTISNSGPKPLERQGTFTKEDKRTTKIPLPSARSVVETKTIPKPRTSNSKLVTATSRSIFYTRSPSADRDSVHKSPRNGLQNSTSSQSLKSTDSNRTLTLTPSSKRSSIPNIGPQRSNSNASIISTGSNGKKKQVVSKIASIWKRNDNNKKQQS